MNHVPDETLEAIDAFGSGLLTGTPPPVDSRLRQDLWVRIEHTENHETARCRYKTVHTQAPQHLRDRGSFLTTIVDGVDKRLLSWGIQPPDAYEHVETVEDTHYYEGLLTLP